MTIPNLVGAGLIVIGAGIGLGQIGGKACTQSRSDF